MRELTVEELQALPDPDAAKSFSTSRWVKRSTRNPRRPTPETLTTPTVKLREHEITPVVIADVRHVPECSPPESDVANAPIAEAQNEESDTEYVASTASESTESSRRRTPPGLPQGALATTIGAPDSQETLDDLHATTSVPEQDATEMQLRVESPVERPPKRQRIGDPDCEDHTLTAVELKPVDGTPPVGTFDAAVACTQSIEPCEDAVDRPITIAMADELSYPSPGDELLDLVSNAKFKGLFQEGYQSSASSPRRLLTFRRHYRELLAPATPIGNLQRNIRSSYNYLLADDISFATLLIDKETMTEAVRDICTTLISPIVWECLAHGVSTLQHIRSGCDIQCDELINLPLPRPQVYQVGLACVPHFDRTHCSCP